MSLQLLKAEVLSVLADAYDETAWSDAVLEEALRQALVFFHPYAMLRESTFTLLDSGYEHDLSSLKAHEIVYIGWPWDDGYLLEQVARKWRLISEGTIRMDDLDLDSGEEVRVQYRPRHTIQYLDGVSAETTFLELEQRRFVLAAASFALRLRSRFHSHVSDKEQRERIAFLQAAADALMAQFLAFEAQEPGTPNYVTWGSLGL